MNREKFVRWSGWALIAGAILFGVGLILGNFDTSDLDPIGGPNAFYEIGEAVGILVGQILFVVGLLGLRAGFGDRSGGLGGGFLLVAVVGAGVSLAGVGMARFKGNSWEGSWIAWMLGLLTMTLALAVFGVVASRRRVFSRWNFAPIVAGLAIPLAIIVGMTGVNLGVRFGERWPSFLAVMITCLGLILVGYRMQADVTPTSPAVA